MNKPKKGQMAAIIGALAAGGATGHLATNVAPLTDEELAAEVVSRAGQVEFRKEVQTFMDSASAERKAMRKVIEDKVQEEVETAQSRIFRTGPFVARRRMFERYGEDAVAIDPSGRDMWSNEPSVRYAHHAPIHLRRCLITGRKWTMIQGEDGSGTWFGGEYFPPYGKAMTEDVQP
jgi:hypothetical protein